MKAWRDRRILDLFGIELPIILAPMAGPGTPELAIAVSEAGGLGSLPCAQLSSSDVRAAIETIRRTTSRPINLNFFCHTAPAFDQDRDIAWRTLLKPYYLQLGLNPEAPLAPASRKPFDHESCMLIEEFKPEIVSFHFGLPEQGLLDRVKAAQARVIASATTVREARWLESHGCDAIIAMGFEAGGHRGNFLSDDMARQVGTFALVPQIVDTIKVPVIAAGGVADARGIVAALALGASAVQIGTAYLFCPEARVPPLHLEALTNAADDDTMLTNVFTGRPARGIVNRLMLEAGPMASTLPDFPLASSAVGPLRAMSEPAGSRDFMNLWSGQAARLARRGVPAGEMTRALASEALAKL
ncbi:MAG TPA: nitronate monooxygenase family protein [Candidatus Binataceae bacterium]|nr:nitronate monooxygenase family protein [Candidatus Binataceae bacterium]